MGKDKATVIFRRLASGEVFGEIIDEKGIVVECRNFGVMTEYEYIRILILEKEYPDVGAIQRLGTFSYTDSWARANRLGF